MLKPLKDFAIGETWTCGGLELFMKVKVPTDSEKIGYIMLIDHSGAFKAERFILDSYLGGVRDSAGRLGKYGGNFG